MQDRNIRHSLVLGLSYALVIAISLLASLRVYGVALNESYQALLLISSVLGFFLFRRIPLTVAWQFLRPGSPGTRVIITWALFATGLMAAGFFFEYGADLSRAAIGTWLLATPVAIFAFHVLMRYGVLRAFPSLTQGRSAVIVFVNESARMVAERVGNSGYNVVGYFEDRQLARVGGGIDNLPLLGKAVDAADYVKENNIEVVFIILPEGGLVRASKILDDLGDTTASVFYVPDWYVFTLMQSQLYEIEGIPVLEVIETPFYGVDGLLKRIFDIIGATAILLLTIPLWVAIAIAVRVTSPGPVIFRQRRYGLHGEKIIVHKFRSMTVTQDDERLEQATRDDPRITAVGRFLRRTSLDEWPQFWNVLKGDMSLVGPRPHAVAHNEFYRGAIQGYMSRHKVKPGVTGWAQVNGYRGETRTLERMEKRIELDLEYIRNWSPLLDIQIIFKTILVVFKDENAY
ncbi:undecaprenyl-phosphate glucose phosphotransferase [bacterium]|nr:undecaprenyl-phosphate glucose phosphotransferase [bacterium]